MRFSWLSQGVVSKDYFSVKLISRLKFSGIYTRDCISLKLIELFLFRCKSSFGSVTHHRKFYVIRVTISSFKFFFPGHALFFQSSVQADLQEAWCNWVFYNSRHREEPNYSFCGDSQKSVRFVGLWRPM